MTAGDDREWMKGLPAGPREMSAEAVDAHRRRRVIEAASAIGVEAGYRAMTVSRIAPRASVASGSVYGLFGNADGVRRAVLNQAIRDVISPACDAFDRRSSFAAGVADALSTLADRVAENRRSAFLCFNTMQEADHEILARRAQIIAHAAAALRAGATGPVALVANSPTPVAYEIAVGGVCHVVADRLIEGRSDLHDLVPDLTDSLLRTVV